MRLYLVHCGYYDPEVGSGVYEIHTNFMVAAPDPQCAKARAKELPEFRKHRMHVDGVQEIRAVDGFKVELEKDQALEGRTVINSFKHSDLSNRTPPNA